VRVFPVVCAALALGALATTRASQDPPPRDAALVALVEQAESSPPEFAADALLRIATSSRIVDPAWRRELLDEAFMRAYGVREQYRRGSTQPLPPDTRQGAQELAYLTSLTRVSLQVRATQLMAVADVERARELFEWIELNLAPGACDDPLVPAVDEYYAALSLLARTTFGDDRGEALRFLSLYLWRAHLPSEMPAVAKALEKFAPQPDEAPFLENLYRWILVGGSADARGFSSAALDIVSRTADLHHAYALRGMTNVRMFDALRPYVIARLREPRCGDSLAESQTPAAFNAAIKRLNVNDDVKPIEADVARPSRMLGIARFDAYWQTPEARRLYDDAIRLRGTGQSLPSERVRRSIEWRNQADRLLVDVELWTGRRERDERDYFYQKSLLLSGLMDVQLPSPGRTRAIRAMVNFLRQSDAVREHRALWFAFLTRLLDGAGGDSRREILNALENTHHPILSLYARLDRVASTR
jgi:hypothetical protein